MSALDVWYAIGLLLLSTLISRCVVFLVAHRMRLPPLAQHALRYAPAAAMAAIVLPDLLLAPGGVPDIGWHNPKLLAGLGAAIFFLVTRHMLGMIAVGMLLYSVLRVVFTG